MRNKIVMYIAKYVAPTQGFLLLVTAFYDGTGKSGIVIFLTGTILLGIGVLFAKILKRIIGKYRPKDKLELFVPQDVYAFPSGHATGLTVMTVFIFEKSVELGILSCILSLLVIWARIVLKAHDFIDIVGGIVLGSVVVYFLAHPIEWAVLEYLSTHVFF